MKIERGGERERGREHDRARESEPALSVEYLMVMCRSSGRSTDSQRGQVKTGKVLCRPSSAKSVFQTKSVWSTVLATAVQRSEIRAAKCPSNPGT